MKVIPKIFILVLFVSTIAGCSKFSRLMKSDNIDEKIQAAIKYYEKKDYFRAGSLLEDLLPLMSGKQNGEKVMYYYAYCQYGQEEFTMASYYFKRFYETYPRSENAEEAYYMYAFCLYLDSPKYNLDQTNTFKAIGGIISFINLFPESKRVPDGNKYLDELRQKIQQKDYQSAKLYYKLGYYRSAVIALNNFITEYPGSDYNEEFSFLKLDAQYNLTKISTESKKKERLKDALVFYENFVDDYPSSKQIKTAENIYDNIRNQLNKIN